MNNQQLLKYAHVWFLAVLCACGLLVIAVKAGIEIKDQNSNQNSNSNSTANSNKSQNRNSNRSNRNTSATGEQTGMANMTSQDRDFVMDAAMGGLEEVRSEERRVRKECRSRWS